MSSDTSLPGGWDSWSAVFHRDKSKILTGRGRGRGDCMQPRPEIRAETPRAPLRTESSRRMLETN